jgi:hypothetical protein
MVREVILIKWINLIDGFLDENSWLKKFANTISAFSFSIITKSYFSDEIANIIIRKILKLFVNLTHLEFSRYSSQDIFYFPFGNDIPMYSSTLLELHINVPKSIEFLSLLDGRLSHLHTFYVKIQTFFGPSVDIDMKVNEK